MFRSEIFYFASATSATTLFLKNPPQKRGRLAGSKASREHEREDAKFNSFRKQFLGARKHELFNEIKQAQNKSIVKSTTTEEKAYGQFTTYQLSLPTPEAIYDRTEMRTVRYVHFIFIIKIPVAVGCFTLAVAVLFAICSSFFFFEIEDSFA